MNKTIGVIISGGDCGGLNAVVSGIVKVGVRLGYEFVGFERGWEGILDRKYRVLDTSTVKGISHLGGTILHTTNHGRFAAKTGEGNAARIDPDILQQTRDNLEAMKIDGLIVIGGDGTLSGALQLAELGVKIVGVPKSIDNDLSATDKTFGFSTAVQIATEALDKIHTTATSHERVFFVECMGRHAGWISLYAGLAGSANAILLPEFNVNMDALVSYLKHRQESQKRSAVVVVAEGIKLPGRVFEEAGHVEVRLAGVSEILMGAIEKMEPGRFEMRHVVLGHTQRGGTPNAQDRILSKRYGVGAIEAYHENKFGHMIRVRDGHIETVPLVDAVSQLKLVTLDNDEYNTAKKIGIYLNS